MSEQLLDKQRYPSEIENFPYPRKYSLIIPFKIRQQSAPLDNGEA